MLKVYAKKCANCLFSPNKIVSDNRRKEIIQGCIQSQEYFICHKASMNNEDVCCKAFYDTMGGYSQLIRIAQRMGAVEFVDLEDDEKLPTYEEMNNEQN